MSPCQSTVPCNRWSVGKWFLGRDPVEGPGKATRGERAWVKDLWREKNLAVPARSWPELYHTQLPRVPFLNGSRDLRSRSVRLWPGRREALYSDLVGARVLRRNRPRCFGGCLSDPWSILAMTSGWAKPNMWEQRESRSQALPGSGEDLRTIGDVGLR